VLKKITLQSLSVLTALMLVMSLFLLPLNPVNASSEDLSSLKISTFIDGDTPVFIDDQGVTTNSNNSKFFFCH